MLKSYKLKIYANEGKIKEINKLLSFWKDQVNHKIKIFWQFDEVRSSYCPSKYSLGGRLIRDSSLKAWYIVKGAKKAKQIDRPYFKGDEIDLNEASGYIIPDFQTKEFDIWFNIISLNKRSRLKIPCKRIDIFNEALEKGKLKKSFKLVKEKDKYYMECYIEFPDNEKENEDMIGIDVGLNNAIAISDGKILGKELKDLRIRTKHRVYKKKISPIKQKLNYYAKKLVEQYPKTDFAVENLLFKGKKKRSREFRRRNNNWAYKHLADKLQELGKAEGFSLIKVDPAYTSLRCPVCGCTDKMNRKGEEFRCIQCGHKGNADIIGAINILLSGRVIREPSVPLIAQEV